MASKQEVIEFDSNYAEEMENFECQEAANHQPRRCILPKIEDLIHDSTYPLVSIDRDFQENDDSGSEIDILGIPLDMDMMRQFWTMYEPPTPEHYYEVSEDWFQHDDPNLNQTAVAENPVVVDDVTFDINHSNEDPHFLHENQPPLDVSDDVCMPVIEDGLEAFEDDHIPRVIKREPTETFNTSEEEEAFLDENDGYSEDYANNESEVQRTELDPNYEFKKWEQIDRNRELMWLLSPIRRRQEILREKHQNLSKHPPMRRQKFSLTNRILRPKRKQTSKTARKNLSLERWQQEVATKLVKRIEPPSD